MELSTIKNKGMTWLGILALIYCTALIIYSEPSAAQGSSPYIYDKNGIETDSRMSPNGRVRPTLASTTIWARIDYYNPNTGTMSTYRCEVDLNIQGHVQRINWPNGGWLEADDLIENADGTQTIIRRNGAEYTVHLTDGSDYTR